MKKSIIVSLVLICVILLLACQASQPTANPYPPSIITATPLTNPPMPVEQSALTKIAIAYILSKTNISQEQMVVTAEEPIHFLYLEKFFWRVGIFFSLDEVGYDVLVDPDDGTVYDLAEVEEADRARKYEKYGKLDPFLYDELQNLNADEWVDVAIWVAGMPRRSEMDRHLALAERYPEARQALEKKGNVFDVDNEELHYTLSRENSRMMIEDYQELIQPLVDDLNAEGYEVQFLLGAPVVTLKLSKKDILEIQNRPEIGAIYLNPPIIEIPEGRIVIPGDQ
jgi:hypothetical protein